MTSRVLEYDSVRERVPGELRRPIIVDAFTVTAGHLNFRDGLPCYSVKGLLLVFRYFVQQGHKVLAFVPPSWLKRDCPFIFDGHVMEELERLELVKAYNMDTAAPSGYKYFQWLKYSIRRDTLDIARSMGGVIVSYFQYRPHQDKEPMAETYKQIVSNRLLVPTFLHSDVYFPLDGAKGRRGKKLADMLKCMPREEDYVRCVEPGYQLDLAQQEHLLLTLNQLIQSCTFTKSTMDAPRHMRDHHERASLEPVSQLGMNVAVLPDIHDEDITGNLIIFDEAQQESNVNQLIDIEDTTYEQLIDFGDTSSEPAFVATTSSSLQTQDWMLNFDPFGPGASVTSDQAGPFVSSTPCSSDLMDVFVPEPAPPSCPTPSQVDVQHLPNPSHVINDVIDSGSHVSLDGEWYSELEAVFGEAKVQKAMLDNPTVKDLDLLAAVILASDQ